MKFVLQSRGFLVHFFGLKGPILDVTISCIERRWGKFVLISLFLLQQDLSAESRNHLQQFFQSYLDIHLVKFQIKVCNQIHNNSKGVFGKEG